MNDEDRPLKECIVAVVGFVVGALVVTIATVFQPNNPYDLKEMTDKCEVNLPRSQKCKIIAVPESFKAEWYQPKDLYEPDK